MTKFNVVTEVGEFTRTSEHPYRYVIAAHRPLTDTWMPGIWVATWSTKLELAQHKAAHDLRYYDDIRVYAVETGAEVYRRTR